MNVLKCYIYGAGGEYQKLASYLPLYRNQIEVLGIVTTEKLPYAFLDGFPCILPNEMQMEGADFIIIAVKKWEEVYSYLKTMEIGDDKILRSHIFAIPNFNLEKYLELRNSNISILANSCMAGMVYAKLGLKTLSPTINTSCPNETFIEFLNHYRYYLNMDMKECGNEYDNNVYDRELFRPTGMIDNRIKIHFPHVAAVSEGVKTWNKKRKDVNYDNIAALMIIYTDKGAEEFEKLPIKKKLGFYYKDFGLKSVLCLPEWEREELRFQYEFFWHRYVLASLDRIDWIEFLNGGENFLRYQ